MLALEGQHRSELGMRDRKMGAELKRLPSEAMRAFERDCIQVVFIQRLDPAHQVSLRKHGMGTSVVRVEGNGAIEEASRFVKKMPRFVKIGRVAH
jgi:hypothetical protein